MSSESIKTLSLRELFGAEQYVIPIYQRNYAWEAKEINQLIQDIADYAVRNKPIAKGLFDEGADNYYIGTLVVYERSHNGTTTYETIDGQQRLTTLNVLINVLRRELGSEINSTLPKPFLNISFDSRPHATETLYAIAADTDEVPYQSNKTYSPAIKRAYTIAHTSLPKILKDARLKLDDFYKYLMSRVFILRVSVPHDTDLNHYFEIMNNRGEQLEKHEILKARLLEKIQQDKIAGNVFSKVWEACADMERYVQYGFPVEQRRALFQAGDDWNTLRVNSFEDLTQRLATLQQNREQREQDGLEVDSLSIEEILKRGIQFTEEKKDPEEAPERFSSVISFPNFLLHVLRIQTGEDIPLDDKRLLETFDLYLKGDEQSTIAFVHQFCFSLLKAKFLFDKYIIKREILNGKEEWSLKRLKRYAGGNVSWVNTFGEEDVSKGENQNLIMLLAMFHVSAPTQIYKHWLNAALNFVFERQEVDAQLYQEYLENLARTYLFNRYLKKEPDDYYQIIYKGVTRPEEVEIDKTRLNQGTAVENFIFNYLDYLLWKREFKGHQNFEFAFRTSVEHYYPQRPLGNIEKLKSGIDDFGNICLISSSKNSQLSNNLPSGKKDYYHKVGADSLKQQRMMDYDNWGVDEIREHGSEMETILFEELINFSAHA